MSEPQLVGCPDRAHGREVEICPTFPGEPDREVEMRTDHTTEELSSLSARVLGPGARQVAGAAVSREELMERGVPASQASARVVREHEEQVLAEHYRCCILSFTCLVVLMLPVILGVFVWMVVEWVRYRGKDCDVPLQMWCHVVWVVVVFNLTVRRFVIKYVCRWQPAPRDSRDIVLIVPLRVKLFNISISIFMFVWTCVGLHWVRISGARLSTNPSCRDEAPGLWEAVRTYAAINLCFTVFLYAYLHGISRILATMMRAGMLQTNQAAPPGSLEANTEGVDAADPLVIENQSCSVCLEDFSDKKDIVRTKECNHIFHKQCLHGWLKVQRSCPLCRRDLGLPDGTMGLAGDLHPV